MLPAIALYYTLYHYQPSQFRAPFISTVKREESIPSCENILDERKGGKESKSLATVFKTRPTLDDLAYFPTENAEFILKVEDKKLPNIYHTFYKENGSRRDWDYALTSHGSTALTLYVAIGQMVDEFEMIVPRDLKFEFHKNPLDTSEIDFKPNSLKNYNSWVMYVCANDIRAYLEEIFQEARKEVK